MAKIVHFDMSANDIDRAKRFYESLFDWEFTLLPGPEEYHIIATKGLDGSEGLGGGMAKRRQPGEGITNFVEVESIDESLKLAQQLGGAIVQDKTEIPGIAYIGVISDTEQNEVGVIEGIPGSPFSS